MNLTGHAKQLITSTGMSNHWKIIRLCLSIGCAFFLNLATFSPFFTPDSFHYLQLSLHPVAGDSHPVGFGLFLFFIKTIADLFQLNFLILFFLFIISTIVIATTFYCSFPSDSTKRSPFAYLFFILYIFLLLPALLIFSSAIWSESFYWLVLFLISGFFLVKSKRLGGQVIHILLIAVLCTYLYHIRYEGIVLIPSLFLTAIIFFIRSEKNTAFKYGFAGIMYVAFLLLSITLLQKTIPSVDVDKKMVINNWRISAQCTLRCSHPLFENKCNQPGVYEPIEQASCSDIVVGYVKMSSPLPQTLTITGFFKELGIKDTIHWLFLAPFKYLSDINARWNLEIGKFDMKQLKFESRYPDVIPQYYKYFNYYANSPSKLFNGLYIWVNFLHFELKAYNWFCFFSIFFSLFLIITSKKPVAVFLCFVSLGTLLLFSYFNPYVPLRYLIHILLPFSIAVGIHKN